MKTCCVKIPEVLKGRLKETWEPSMTLEIRLLCKKCQETVVSLIALGQWKEIKKSVMIAVALERN